MAIGLKVNVVIPKKNEIETLFKNLKLNLPYTLDSTQLTGFKKQLDEIAKTEFKLANLEDYLSDLKAVTTELENQIKLAKELSETYGSGSGEMTKAILQLKRELLETEKITGKHEAEVEKVRVKQELVNQGKLDEIRLTHELAEQKEKANALSDEELADLERQQRALKDLEKLLEKNLQIKEKIVKNPKMPTQSITSLGKNETAIQTSMGSITDPTLLKEAEKMLQATQKQTDTLSKTLYKDLGKTSTEMTDLIIKVNKIEEEGNKNLITDLREQIRLLEMKENRLKTITSLSSFKNTSRDYEYQSTVGDNQRKLSTQQAQWRDIAEDNTQYKLQEDSLKRLLELQGKRYGLLSKIATVKTIDEVNQIKDEIEATEKSIAQTKKLVTHKELLAKSTDYQADLDRKTGAITTDTYAHLNKLSNEYFSNQLKIEKLNTLDPQNSQYKVQALKETNVELEKEIEALNEVVKLEQLSDFRKDLKSERTNEANLRKEIELKGVILDKDTQQRANALELIDLKKRELELKVKNLEAGRNADYVDTKRLNELKNSINSLDGATTKDVQKQVKQLNQDLRELTQDANLKRLSDTKKGINSLGTAFQSVTKYFSAAMVVQNFFQALREGLDDVRLLNDAFTTLKMTMTKFTDNDINSLLESTKDLSNELSASYSSVLNTVMEIANDGEDISTIINKTRPSAILANIGNVSEVDAVSMIQGAMRQFSEFADQSEEDAMKVANSMTSISQSLGLGFQDGLQGMSSTVSNVGSYASMLGMTFDETMAMVSATVEKTRLSFDEVSVALRAIMARTMRITDDSVDASEATFLKAEKTLASIGIAIRNVETQEMRSFVDIMRDLSEVWGDLEGTTKNKVADSLGGAMRVNSVLGLLDSFTRAEKLTEIAEKGNEGVGAAMEAQEIWAESLSAKLQQLESSVAQFWMAFLDSDAYGGVIELLTNLVNVATKLVESFGAIPSMVGTASASFLVFNKGVRSAFSNYSEQLIRTVFLQENFNKVSSQTGDIAGEVAGAIVGQTVKTENLSTTLTAATLKTITMKVATVALQAAMTMGLSFAITAVVTGISNLVSKFETLEERFKKTKEALNDLTDSYNSFKDTSDKINDYQQAVNKFNHDKTLTSDERLELEKEIEELTKELISDHGEYQAILENEKLTLGEKLVMLREINNEKMKEKALEAVEDVDQKTIDQNASNLNHLTRRFEATSKLIEKMKASGDEWHTPNVAGGVSRHISDYEDDLEELRQDIIATYTDFQTTNSQILLLNENGELVDLTITDISESAQGVVDGIMDAEEAAIKLENATNDVADSMTDAEKAAKRLADQRELNQTFLDVTSQLEEAKELLDSINEEGLTLDSAESIFNNFEDFGGDINSFEEVHNFLTNKIDELAQKQGEAYATMKQQDEDFWNSKMKNSDEWVNYVVNAENEIISATEKSIGIQSGDFADFINKKGGFRQIDLSNVDNLLEAQETTEQQTIKDLQELWRLYYVDKVSRMDSELQAMINSGASSDAIRQQMIANKITFKELMKELNAGMAAIENFQFSSKPSYIPQTVIGGNGSSSGSSSSSSSKDKVADLQLEIDRYFDLNNVIEDLNNTLERNQQLQTSASPKKKLQLMKEEINLYKQQQQAYEKLRKEQQKEANELKKMLQKNGFKFNGDELINYSSQLTKLVTNANKKTGEAKEKAIDSVEAIADAIERFIELTNSEIPSTTQTWQEMADTIRELERENLEYIADIQSQISDAIQQELEKQTEATRKELEKRRDLYDEQYNEENWQDELKAQQKVIDELNQQINDLSRDTSKAAQIRLEQLKEEYQQAMEEMNQMIRDHEHENGLNAFDKEMEELDQALENAIDPENLAQLVNQALNKGFVELNGVVYQTENLLHNMLTSSTEGFFALGKTLKEELIDGLELAKGLFMDIGSLATGLGSSVSSKTRSLTNPFSVPASYGLNEMASTVQNINNQSVHVSFESLLNVAGNLDHTILDEVTSMLEVAKSEVVHEIATSLQTR